MMRPFAAALLALAALAPIAASAAVRAGDPEPALTFPTATGKTLALASYKGKPVYLNFYATWCPPCNSEAPSVGKLAATYEKRGLAVIGVDELESAAKAQSFIAHYHLAYPAVLDADGGALRAFGGFGLPVHVFITRSGTVKLVHIGEMSPPEIEAAIKSIL
jgi:peroxiredoxin